MLLLCSLARAGALQVAIGDMPAGLDPWAPPGSIEARLSTLVYDRIFTRDPETGAAVSRVVDAEPDADGWLLTVRHLRWHDGRLATAEDLCFSVLTALDARAPSWWSGPAGEAVSACTPLDARRARLASPPGVDDPRPGLAIPFVPKHAYDGDPWFDSPLGRAPNGTGRYRAHRTPTGWALHATRSAGIRALHLVSAESDDAAVDRLLAGDADGVLQAPPARVAALVAADGIALRWTNRQQLLLIALNTHDGPAADPAVRRALDFLLDRKELRTEVAGLDPTDERQPATLVSGPFFPRSPWSARSIPPTAHEPAAANVALSAAGFVRANGRWERDGAPLRIRLAGTAPSIARMKPLLAIGGQWNAAGIEVEGVILSPSAYAKALAGSPPEDVDAILMTWDPPWGESPGPLVGTHGWSNPFGYSDPAVDRELAALSDPDPDTARHAAWELHGRLADRSPFLFLWSWDAWSAWSDDAVTFTPLTPGDLFGSVESWH